jgi:hypothetical protein
MTLSDTQTSTLLLWFLRGDQVIELQGISVFIDNAYIKVFNVYIPPVSANTRYSPNISNILDISDDALVLGDLNAYNEAWFWTLSIERADTFFKQVDSSKFFILNSDTPTKCPSNGNVSPADVSLISVHLALAVTWCTHGALNRGW